MKKFTIYDTKLNFRQDEEKGGHSRDNYTHYKLFSDVLHFLAQNNFYVGKDKEVDKKYPVISKYHRQGHSGNLEFKAERYPAGFEILFFQNVIHENPHGGEYDFDKREKMPYLIGKQYDLIMGKLCEYLIQLGIEDYREPICVLAEDKIKANYVESWHHPQKDMNFCLSDLDGQAESFGTNGLDRDANSIQNGDVKYFRDSGYLCRGKVYHNINNMWWVITDKYTVRNQASFKLFDLSPDDERRRKAMPKIPAAYKNRREQLSAASIKELKNELKRRKRNYV